MKSRLVKINLSLIFLLLVPVFAADEPSDADVRRAELLQKKLVARWDDAKEVHSLNELERVLGKPNASYSASTFSVCYYGKLPDSMRVGMFDLPAGAIVFTPETVDELIARCRSERDEKIKTISRGRLILRQQPNGTIYVYDSDGHGNICTVDKVVDDGPFTKTRITSEFVHSPLEGRINQIYASCRRRIEAIKKGEIQPELTYCRSRLPVCLDCVEPLPVNNETEKYKDIRRWCKIEKGRTEQQVIIVLGEPANNYTSEDGSRKIFSYYKSIPEQDANQIPVYAGIILFDCTKSVPEVAEWAEPDWIVLSNPETNELASAEFISPEDVYAQSFNVNLPKPVITRVDPFGGDPFSQKRLISSAQSETENVKYCRLFPDELAQPSRLSNDVATEVRENIIPDLRQDGNTISGRGSKTVGPIYLPKALMKFEFSYTGNSNFIIEMLDSSGNMEDVVVNEIGNTRGSKAIGIRNAANYHFNIVGDGSWQFTILADGFNLPEKKGSNDFKFVDRNNDSARNALTQKKLMVKVAKDAVQGICLGESLFGLRARNTEPLILIKPEGEVDPYQIWRIASSKDYIKNLYIYTYEEYVYKIVVEFTDSSQDMFKALNAKLAEKYEKVEANDLSVSEELLHEVSYFYEDNGVHVKLFFNHDVGFIEKDSLSLSYIHSDLANRVFKQAQETE